MSASALASRVDGQLNDWQRLIIKPMAALAVRFSGRSLPHVGRAVLPALELLLTRAPPSTSWRGVTVKGNKGTHRVTPRPVTAAGLKPVRDSLTALKAMPPGAFEFRAKDGSPEARTPETFAVWVGLARTGKATYATPRGFLSFAVPLEALEAPASLLALGDRLVETLDAEAAWLGPAVWLAPHCQFDSDSYGLLDEPATLIELFGVDPQLDAPHLYASRWPHSQNEVAPNLWSGLLAPAWTMWLDAKLAQKVRRFPGPWEKHPGFSRYQLSEKVPFEMTETTYAQWRAGWAALAPVHLRCSDTSITGRYFRGRLSGETHAGLLAGWRRENEWLPTARRRPVP